MQALVFVGDAMEENPDILVHDAAALGKADVPAFMFQEGHDRAVEQVFRDIARLTQAPIVASIQEPRGLGRAPACGGGLCSWRNGGAREPDRRRCH